MRNTLLLAVAILFSFSFAAFAQNAEEDLDPQYATELLKPGALAPDFTLKDLFGRARSLSEFRGKQVVLVFWASWCPDCRAEVPQLKAMMASADPSKVAFVSVSYDRDFDTLVKYVEDNNIAGVQLYDPAGKKESKVGADYHVKWIPSLYLIGTDGKVELSTVMIGKVVAALDNAQTVPMPGKKGLCSEEGCE